MLNLFMEESLNYTVYVHAWMYRMSVTQMMLL